MRREIAVRETSGSLEIARARVLEARANAMPHQHVHGGLLARFVARLNEVQISQRMILGEVVLERFDEARRRDRACRERDAERFERPGGSDAEANPAQKLCRSPVTVTNPVTPLSRTAA